MESLLGSQFSGSETNDRGQQGSDNLRMNRREQLFLLWAVSAGGVVIALATAFLFLVLPHPEWVDLGSTEQLAKDEPTPHALTLSDGTSLSLWIVHARGQWLVFDATTPFGTHCQYQWQRVTGRFEDPCSGSKFSITGEFLDVYNAFAGQTVRNLDRYTASVRDNHLFIDAHRLLRAEPFVARALTPDTLR